MDDGRFTQLSAAAMNLPFSIDMKALDGAWIAGSGRYQTK